MYTNHLKGKDNSLVLVRIDSNWHFIIFISMENKLLLMNSKNTSFRKSLSKVDKSGTT